MGATAVITIKATVSGLVEGGVDLIDYTQTNTSAAHTITLAEVTTAVGTATQVVLPSSGRYLLAIPPATNTINWRLTHSTDEAGFPMSSQGAVLMGLQGVVGARFYTTAGTTFTMRVLTY